ncbi:centromere-associated protein E-like [Lingula anatina]|uniref:Centromere-associated protein E-like n=1 Tax=Lingula anatina TaxID=7574 RepID=A0A1S3KFQ1_LINAN|nr:centromere-associated protein E-like [Lingula anatina]|eukprot:XP_013421317.1 centromere-associated protein E-like [Lingula anatina]
MGLFRKKVLPDLPVRVDPEYYHYGKDMMALKNSLNQVLLTMKQTLEDVNKKTLHVADLEDKMENMSSHITDSENNIAMIEEKCVEKEQALNLIKQQIATLQEEKSAALQKISEQQDELDVLKTDLKAKCERIAQQDENIAALNDVLIAKDKSEILEAREKADLKRKVNELTLALASRDREVEELHLKLTKTKDEMASLSMKTSQLQKNVLEELNAVTKEQTLVLQKMKERSPARLIDFLEKQEYNILSRKEKFELRQQLYDAELKEYQSDKEKAHMQAKISQLNQLVASMKIEGRSTPDGAQKMLERGECTSGAVVSQVIETPLGKEGAVSDPTALEDDDHAMTTCPARACLPSQVILDPT